MSLFNLSFLCVLYCVTATWFQGPCSSTAQVQRNEGYNPCRHNVAGIPHVCFGFNLQKSGAGSALSAVGAPSISQINSGTCVSRTKCEQLLSRDMSTATSCASRYVSNWNSLNSCRKSALVDMAYNLGCGGLGNFRRLKAAVERSDWSSARAEIQDSGYCTQVGCRCQANKYCMDPCGGLSGSCESRRPSGVSCSSCGGGSGGPLPTPPPVQSCTWSSWSNSGSCQGTCGGSGSQRQTRVPSRSSCTGQSSRNIACSTPPCASCTYSSWTNQGTCGGACNTSGNNQQQTRRVLSGSNCREPLSKYVFCQAPMCPCVYGQWTKTSACSAQCGPGTQTEGRGVNDSRCPQPLTRQVSCNNGPCFNEGDCVSKYGQWVPTGPCNAACGQAGQQPEGRGSSDNRCPGPYTRMVSCQGDPCVENCVGLGQWADSGQCSARCDQQGQVRQVRSNPSPSTCKATTQRMVGCQGPPCATLPPVNCVWANWGGWSACSVGCGAGQQSRQRNYLTPPANGGTACQGKRLETKTCNVQCQGSCVTNVDCKVSEWGAWSPCYYAAKKKRNVCVGERTRDRQIVMTAKCQGKACPALSETASCNDACGPNSPGQNPNDKPPIGGGVDPNNPNQTPSGGGAQPIQTDAYGNVVPDNINDDPEFSSDEGIGTGGLAAIIAGSAVCCLLITALVIIALCVAMSPAEPAAPASEMQPTNNAIAVGNPLFYAQEQKAYNPLFYAGGTGSGGPGLVTAPGSGQYASAGMPGAAAPAGQYAAGAGYDSAAHARYGSDLYVSAREPNMESAIFAPGNANTCPICNKAYPSAEDLEHHVEKRHGGGADGNYPSAQYPSSVAPAYPNGGGGSLASYPSSLAPNYPSGESARVSDGATAYPSGAGNYPSTAGYGCTGTAGVFPCADCGKNYPTAEDLETHRSLRH